MNLLLLQQEGACQKETLWAPITLVQRSFLTEVTAEWSDNHLDNHLALAAELPHVFC